jgi:hypothetical protein
MHSLQLDVQSLQKNREEDKHEFLDFRANVQQNFVNIKKKLQAFRQTLIFFRNGSKMPQQLSLLRGL